MPSPATPIPNQPKWAPREFSRYRNPRDNGSPMTQWKNELTYAQQINALTEFCKVIWKELAKVKGPISTLDMHPFRIYSIPNVLYYNSVDSGSTRWRTFNVRNGCVLTDVVSTGSVVFGTDGMPCTLVDQNIYPTPIGTGSSVVVPNLTPQYWFWIEKPLTGSFPAPTGSYILRHGPNPAAASTGNPNPWDTFPSASSNHWPIGYVDTYTSASQYQAYVRQFQRTDITTSGGGGHYVTMSICLDGSAATWYVDAYPASGSA